MLTMTAAGEKAHFGQFFADRLARTMDAVAQRAEAKSERSGLDPIGNLRILSPRASLGELSSGG